MPEKIKELVLLETKKGFGYKILIDEIWLYTSRADLLALILNQKEKCVFKPFSKRKK